MSPYPVELSEISNSPVQTKMSLRPDRALINPNDKMDNIHSGKVEEVIYHGDHTRVRINLLGNDQFILKIPNSTSNLDVKLGNDIVCFTSSLLHFSKDNFQASLYSYFQYTILTHFQYVFM